MSKTIWKRLAERTELMAENALEGIAALSDWEAVRSERKREFSRALGLDPQPERCDLDVRVFSEFSGPGFRARNLGFQILPNCWSSATIYYPDPMPEAPAPALLYTCGHGKIGVWHYQYCPMLWARRGYVCLILDSIEQHDNPGEHHGFSTGKADTWLALGYSPAGAEVWNALRALDVLRADPAADASRIGITGISGGGACAFFTMVMDDQLRALSSLCGISTPKDAVRNRRLFGHCDCMYSFNLYGRDLSEYAALIAPRPAMLCFGDQDPLFHPDETSALVQRMRRIYSLYGAEENCALVTHACGHEDHAVFTEATQKWMDLHLAGEERELLQRGKREVSTGVTSVFRGAPPIPNYVEILPEMLSPTGVLPLPFSEEEWGTTQTKAISQLRHQIEAPGKVKAAFTQTFLWDLPERAKSSHVGEVDGVEVNLEIIHNREARKLLLGVAGGGELFQDVFSKIVFSFPGVAFAALEPRLSGANFPAATPLRRPSGSYPQGVRERLMRAMSLVGHTPTSMTVEDVLVTVEYLLSLPEFSDFEIFLYGAGEQAVAVLYAALLESRVCGVLLDRMPVRHGEGGSVFGMQRKFSLPQAIGLMAPRKVGLVDPGHRHLNWASAVYELLECEGNFVTDRSLQKIAETVLSLA